MTATPSLIASVESVKAWAMASIYTLQGAERAAHCARHLRSALMARVARDAWQMPIMKWSTRTQQGTLNMLSWLVCCMLP